jgi:transposase
LALLVSKDFQIPLFHKTYEGHRPDRGLFPEVSSEIVKWRKKILKGNQKTTLVFDKGNISEDSMINLIIPNQHFICAIPKTTDSNLYSTSIDEFTTVTGIPGTRAYTIPVEIWQANLKAVVAYSDSFFSSELIELTESIRSCEKKLNELERWLEKGPKREHDMRHYSESKIKEKIATILSKPHLKDIVKVKTRIENTIPRITYSVDQKHLELLMRTSLGRTILLTSHVDWSEKEIISAYRSQQKIEEVFRHMKNKEYLHWQPSFHWTDQKIKVHSFYTVMALLFATLAHKMVVEKGIEISLLDMLEELSGIREVALIHTSTSKSKEKDRLIISRMSAKQKSLAEALEIEKILAG